MGLNLSLLISRILSRGFLTIFIYNTEVIVVPLELVPSASGFATCLYLQSDSKHTSSAQTLQRFTACLCFYLRLGAHC